MFLVSACRRMRLRVGGVVMRGEAGPEVVPGPCSPHAYAVCAPWILLLGDEAREGNQREIRTDGRKEILHCLSFQPTEMFLCM